VELHFHLLVYTEHRKGSFATLYIREEDAIEALRERIRINLKMLSLGHYSPVFEIRVILNLLGNPASDYKDIIERWHKYRQGEASCAIYPVSLTLE